MKRICVMLAVLLCVLAAVSCSQEKKIIGEWKASGSILGIELDTVYEFREDMTGTKSTVLGIKTDFRYEFNDDGAICLITEILGQEITEVYQFDVDGDELTLTEENGDTVVLERQSNQSDA